MDNIDELKVKACKLFDELCDCLEALDANENTCALMEARKRLYESYFWASLMKGGISQEHKKKFAERYLKP
jgi:hypothetical protein